MCEDDGATTLDHAIGAGEMSRAFPGLKARSCYHGSDNVPCLSNCATSSKDDVEERNKG